MTSELDAITIARPDDWHVHLRQGDLLRGVVGCSMGLFGRIRPMPNTLPPILTGPQALDYAHNIRQAAGHNQPVLPGLESPRQAKLMLAIMLTDNTTPDMIREAWRCGVTAAKAYPAHATTNSAGGITDFGRLAATFAAMEEAGMTLCLHGEEPTAEVMLREHAFLHRLRSLSHSFPDLRIILEHVSSAEGVAAVSELSANVGATITVHHLVLTLDDVIGSSLNAHAYCKPVAKTATDRAALIAAAVSGNAKYFFGSDSAPHPQAKKLQLGSAAGIFSAPVAIPLLAQIFEAHAGDDWAQRLEEFTSINGARFHGLEPNEDTITLIRRPWMVPRTIAGVVPLQAGQQIGWRVLAD